jgi:integrative and conjugative element protein (TIGR02256 family)
MVAWGFSVVTAREYDPRSAGPAEAVTPARAPAASVAFRSADGRFGLDLWVPHHRRLLELAAGGGDRETGGILIGFYTEPHDVAVVTRVEPPPRDSRRGRTWFERGTHGLRALLRELWVSRREYYLGEWHLHPSAPPIPSGDDITQMLAFARSPQFHCSEPILVIVGGSATTSWRLSAHVFLRDGTVIPLLPAAPPHRDDGGKATRGQRIPTPNWP